MTTTTTDVPISVDDLDRWAIDIAGPVALHLKQKLLPVQGEGGVIFPPTYTGIGYNIDTLSDGTRVATIDSVGSQANRLEPIFKRTSARNSSEEADVTGLAKLVPQINIKVGDEELSILDVGHRLGDALIRSTELADEARSAFQALLRGDALKIAEVAPTSLVFGAWDSRDTSAKLPRILQSVIRAWDVEELKRSAQYNPPVDYAALEVFSDEERAKAEGDSKSAPAKRGFVHVPSVGVPGGVIARGQILREITINLVALRRLQSPERTDRLRRYILGLALVAGTYELDGDLRQGCLLTLDPSGPDEWVEVHRDGTRKPIELDAKAARSYAEATAQAFGVAVARTLEFKADKARADLSGAAGKRTKPRGDAGGRE